MRFSVFLFATALCAHELYFLPSKFLPAPTENLEVALHNGDSFPKSGTFIKPERLRDTRIITSSGAAELTAINAEASRTVARAQMPQKGTALVTARTLPNLIELEPAKFEKYLRYEGLQAVLAERQKRGESAKPGRERYSKYVKSLVTVGTSDETWRKTAGFPIEIVPDADPSSVKSGGTLPVTVLLRGKPLAGMQIEHAWVEGGRTVVRRIGRTDAQGKINVAVRAAGAQRLHALHMERCADPAAADWESFWANLTFAVR